MNGYTLTEKMRKARLCYQLTSYEQALFYELLAICNEYRWKKEFKCSNAKLCDALNISEKTLFKSRRTLINAGLIFYRSGKKNKTENSYSLTTPFESKEKFNSLAKSEVITGNIPVSTGSDTVVTTGLAPDYNNKHNNKTPPNPLRGNESERGCEKLIISFDEIKCNLLGDETWKEQTAMRSGLSINFLPILPAQVDIFLQYIIATGDENSIQTLSDAKRRFFWWWKNHGKKEYEEQSTKSKTIIW